MNATYRELGQEPGWDARTPVDTMIEAANYAVLKDDEVFLVVDAEGDTLQGVCLTNEGGLHYDADTTIQKAYAQQQIEEGGWSLTTNWKTAEEHLK
ncbi:hypothetical protein GGQ10_002117 [Salinibacter ruber]|uniref:hypothetical protein n=1 Tax=Salinibacter ruber TaxID=146919 RepID=UPI002169D171|nr:hypothetical protein [Salinibacter ruber]MCS4087291.1 hypothetical protein [Salinibacter ruber]